MTDEGIHYGQVPLAGTELHYQSRLLSLATKVAVNQIVFTPIFNSYFFGMQSLLAGDGLAQVADRIRRTVPVSFVNSCKLWPAVTAFSFTFVPLSTGASLPASSPSAGRRTSPI